MRARPTPTTQWTQVRFAQQRILLTSILIPTTEDERSIANKLGREEKRQNEKEPESEETKEHKKDATLPVRDHTFDGATQILT